MRKKVVFEKIWNFKKKCDVVFFTYTFLLHWMNWKTRHIMKLHDGSFESWYLKLGYALESGPVPITGYRFKQRIIGFRKTIGLTNLILVWGDLKFSGVKFCNMTPIWGQITKWLIWGHVTYHSIENFFVNLNLQKKNSKV